MGEKTRRSEPPRPLRFGLVPHSNDERSRDLLARLCELLGRHTGLAVEGRPYASPDALASALAAGEAHAAWSSPTLLLLSEAVADAIPLLSAVRQGVAFFHSILFVRDDSPVRTLDQLRGTHVAWVARTSAAGYVMPRISLARQGYDVTRLFARESFHDSHGGVALAVFEKRADVGATFAVFEGGDATRPMVNSGYRHAVSKTGARILHARGPIPSDMIVAMPSVPLRARASFAHAFSKLAEDADGRAVVRALIGAERFEPFSSASFVELEALLRVGRLPGAIG